MTTSEICNSVFIKCIQDYHINDNIDAFISVPYNKDSFEWYLYTKNWIDCVQWHLEDIIRDPEIDPVAALKIKRRIDKSNQERTDMVELIDNFFLHKFSNIKLKDGCTLNTETPAWAIDRLSILALKIFHMNQEVNRDDASEEHRSVCNARLNTLLVQRDDLSGAIDYLIDELESGSKVMKLYTQMKMYNDPSLNPVLYGGGKAV